MKKSYELWYVDNGDASDKTGYLVDTADLSEAFFTGNIDFMTVETDATKDTAHETCEDLARRFAEWQKENDDNDVINFLDDAGINHSYTDDWFYPSESWVTYNGIDHAFVAACDYDLVTTYRHWDGHNHIVWERPDDYDEIEYDSETEISLDRWNGSNFQYGGTGLHAGYAKLEDGRYLVVYRSQWEGDHTIAEIVDEARITQILAENE